jgi:hypothetical protein
VRQAARPGLNSSRFMLIACSILPFAVHLIRIAALALQAGKPKSL